LNRPFYGTYELAAWRYRYSCTQALAEIFDEDHPKAQDLFERYKHMSWSQRQEVVDVPGIITIIYILLYPDGRFHPSKYSPPKIQRLSSTDMLVRWFKGARAWGGEGRAHEVRKEGLRWELWMRALGAWGMRCHVRRSGAAASCDTDEKGWGREREEGEGPDLLYQHTVDNRYIY
jgi:hypothetical protein